MKSWGKMTAAEKDEKFRLIDLVTEKTRRRTSSGINYFKPWGEQADFFKSNARIMGIIGGNKGGKTYGAIARLIKAGMKTDPVWKDRWSGPINIWVASDSHPKNRDTFEPIFRTLMPKNLWHPKMGSREVLDHNTLPDGTRYAFKSYEGKRESFQGPVVHIILLDEEPPKAIWEECLLRGSTCNGVIILCMTAVKGVTWVHRDLYAPSQDPKRAKDMSIEWFHLDSSKSPFIPEAEKRRLRATLSEREYRIRVKGEFIHRQGRVYDDFRRDVHVIRMPELPSNSEIYEVADPGLKVFAMGFYAVTPMGRVWQFDELYENDATPKKMQILIRAKREKWGYKKPRAAYIDPAALARQFGAEGEMNTRDQLARGPMGVWFDADVNKDVESGILRVREYLAYEKDEYGERVQGSEPYFYVSAACEHTIFEFENYVYKDTDPDKQDDKIRKLWDHQLDCFRYLVMKQPPRAELEIEEQGGTTFGEFLQYSRRNDMKKKRSREPGNGAWTSMHQQGMRDAPLI